MQIYRALLCIIVRRWERVRKGHRRCRIFVAQKGRKGPSLPSVRSRTLQCQCPFNTEPNSVQHGAERHSPPTRTLFGKELNPHTAHGAMKTPCK